MLTVSWIPILLAHLEAAGPAQGWRLLYLARAVSVSVTTARATLLMVMVHLRYPLMASRGYPDGKGSDAAIRSYLLTQKFIPAAADSALRSYRETKSLVDSEREAYGGPRQEGPESEVANPNPESGIAEIDWSKAPATSAPLVTGQRRAVFDLSEGEVVITYPDGLSPESVEDLSDYLGVFMKKARREAGLTEQ